MIAAHGHGAPETLAAFKRAHELGADAADVDCALLVQLRALGGKLRAWRPAGDAWARAGFSARRRVAARFAGGGRGASRLWRNAMVYRELCRGARAPRTGGWRFSIRSGIAISPSASARTSASPRRSIWRSRFGRSARSIAPARSPTRRRARIAKLSHLATSTYGLMHCAMFEIIGRKVDRAAPLAKALSSVAHEHGIALWVAFGAFLEAWVELRSGVPEIGLTKSPAAAALLQRG